LIGAAAVVAVLAEGSYRLWDKESKRLTVQPLAPLGMRETGVSVALLQQPAAGIDRNNDDRLLVVAVSAPASRGLTNCSAQIEEFLPECDLEHRPFREKDPKPPFRLHWVSNRSSSESISPGATENIEVVRVEPDQAATALVYSPSQTKGWALRPGT
jgi:hypothetical protein